MEIWGLNGVSSISRCGCVDTCLWLDLPSGILKCGTHHDIFHWNLLEVQGNVPLLLVLMNVIEDWENILKASTWPRVDEKGSKRQNIIL